MVNKEYAYKSRLTFRHNVPKFNAFSFLKSRSVLLHQNPSSVTLKYECVKKE